MRYLVVQYGKPPFFTQWYNSENYKEGMTIIDFQTGTYTDNGRTWNEVVKDSL